MLAPQALVITRASTGYLKGGTCVLIDDDPHMDEVPQYGEYKARDGWKEVEKIRTAGNHGGTFQFEWDEIASIKQGRRGQEKTKVSMVDGEETNRRLQTVANKTQKCTWYMWHECLMTEKEYQEETGKGKEKTAKQTSSISKSSSSSSSSGSSSSSSSGTKKRPAAQPQVRSGAKTKKRKK